MLFRQVLVFGAVLVSNALGAHGVINNIEAHHSIAEPRNYAIQLTEHQKQDITFIVTTLADKSLATIFTKRKELDAAGDRINEVHTYRFLGYIFSDEKLKVAARNIRRRGGIIWKNFSAGVCDTLAEESKKGALTIQDFDAFIADVKIDPRLVYPYIEKKKWNDFLENLIKYVEREGDPDRYNM